MPRELTAQELEQRFADIAPRYSDDQAVAEASRCLYCFDAPCTRSCPTRIDVPGFIRKIMHHDTLGAAETILNANVFGGSCARACPTEVLCEGACVQRALSGEPIQIARLQRYACDVARDKGVTFHAAAPDTGKRVAIVGAGPAGITCGYELRKHGHAVTIFEARPEPGGINTYGIAMYKYGMQFALDEIEQMRQIGGLEIRCNQQLTAAQIVALLAEYDAVFLGIGLGMTASLGIPGEQLAGVWEALDFIFQTHVKPLDQCTVGRNVIVIGAGNTAIDAATAAVRLGAESVRIVYRRTAEAMSAFGYEYDLAQRDGVKFTWLAAPVRIVGDEQGRATGVEFQQTRVATGSGRSAKLEPVPDSNFTIAADMVVKALGQEPLTELLQAIPNLQVERGKVIVDPETSATTVAGLFAGGDCTSRGAEVVNAVAEGKRAAAGIDRVLKGKVQTAKRRNGEK